ncbi:MAG TPA: DHH family phosphoesterase [Candidatus Saccharimonadales bacterium]|nr:DHH family phosphoesterase [Candidatus Saccharimonadales bacterium]
MYQTADQINELIDSAKSIVIVQADNPDADSLGSSLALEHLLGDQDKQVYLYCGVEIPSYLRYMSGWDRVQRDLPIKFDLSIIVDASTMTLLEKLKTSNQMGWLSKRPSIILDHHETVENTVPFGTVTINDPKRASTGELIYLLARQLDWSISKESQIFLMNSILGDTQGLTNQLASAETYKIMASFVEAGVNRPLLEEQRRDYSKMPVEIFRYKAELIKRTVFYSEDRIASVIVGQSEINQYSPLYNPAPLIQNDMLQTEKVRLSIVFKNYDDGKITAAIRANSNSPVAGKLAQKFGGGGHDFASGFKSTSGESIEQITKQCVEAAIQLLDSNSIKTEANNETL